MFRIAAKNRKQRKPAADPWGYRIHDGAAQFRFELEGALSSADVAELDQCWRTASSTIAGKALVVDLTALTEIDESGRQLLNRWNQAGAEFVAGPESLAMLEGWNCAGSAVPAADAGTRRFTRPSFQAALPLFVALLSLLLPATLLAANAAIGIPAPGVESATAPNLALARYVAGIEASQPWGAETVEIEASLPKLKEHGRFRAIRRLLPLGKPVYQVFELNGSRTVKQQVIARYLSAEVEAARMNPSAVAVTPANYRFRYAGSVGAEDNLVYVFQITPRKKRDGLIQGVLWIDGETGTAVRQSGYLVKKPSIFVKRVDVTRETSLRNGVAESRVTHLAVETRLVGRAELTIHERPCVECVDTALSGSN
jgi:hypothetical protein